jgi:hypothetical protein
MYSRRSSATGRDHTRDCPCREASLQSCGASRGHAKHYFARLMQESVAPRAAAACASASQSRVSDSTMIDKPDARRFPPALVGRGARRLLRRHRRERVGARLRLLRIRSREGGRPRPEAQTVKGPAHRSPFALRLLTGSATHGVRTLGIVVPKRRAVSRILLAQLRALLAIAVARVDVVLLRKCKLVRRR